jgi:hypothetical protein
MEFFREWFLSVAGTAIIGVLALAVTPPGAVKKTVQLASALLLIITVLRPLTGWSGDLAPISELWRAETAAAALSAEVRHDLLSAIIEEKTAAYIVTKAQALGLVVIVSAQSRMGGDYPEPWSVSVYSDRPEHAKSALGKMIVQDLGIPAERQHYIQKGGVP